LDFLGSFPLQPIPENERCNNQDEEEGNVAAMQGLRCQIKRKNSQTEKNDGQKRKWVFHAASRFLKVPRG
jgi:hypothetical protein